MMPERVALLHGYEEALSFLRNQLGDDWVMRQWQDGDCSWQFHAPSNARDVAQGWKIHVAIAVGEAAMFARRLAPLLAELRIPFKLPASLDAIAALNAGDGGVEQVGKIATLYPANDRLARQAIYTVDRLWPTSAAPAVRTSLHVRPGSAVAFRFGAFDSRHRIVDSRGIIHAAVQLPDGTLVADERIAGGKPPPGIEPPVPGFEPVVWGNAAGENAYIGDLQLVFLGEIKRATHSRLLFSAVRDSGDTVIVRQRLLGDTRFPDAPAAEADIAREFAVLDEIGGEEGCAPRALALCGGDVPALAMEDVGGELLAELSREERVRLLPLMARALAIVHRRGWTHGDVKLENAILRDGKITFIDFELAERFGAPVSGRGTNAYMPPEAEARTRAHPAQDIYALGISVFHAVTGFPPGMLAIRPGLLADMLRREGANKAPDIVEIMTATDPVARPSAEASVDLLADLAKAAVDGERQGHAPPTMLDVRRAHQSVQDAIQALANFRVADGNRRYWRNAHFQRHFECEAINIGAAGILIGLLVASRTSGIDCRDDIAGAARWLASRPAEDQAAGLFTGNAGVALALAVAARALGTAEFLSASRNRLAAAAADDREFDLFSGSAGTLFAAASISELIEDEWPLDMGTIAMRKLENRRTMVADLNVWRANGDDGADFLGCAHGSAGVAAAIGYWARVTGDSKADAVAISTLKALAKPEMRVLGEQGMPMRLGSDGSHAPGNWCHGTAGFLWALLAGPGPRADLSAELDWAVASLAPLPAIATPTYCHGLAGQLELWQMISAIDRYAGLAAEKIGRIAGGLDLLRHDDGERRIWISDDPSIVTPDLWVGFMGPASALALAVEGQRRTILDGGLLADTADQWAMGGRGIGDGQR
jgi:Lanthionine synthetase C-like protein/Protein kinase domain